MSIGSVGLIPDIPIFYKGNYDMEPIYRACINWMKQHQAVYIYEKLYKEKEIGPGLVDKDIVLVAGVQLDDFRRWNMRITIRSSDTKTLDQIGPSGNPMYHGKLEVLLGSEIEIDYQNAYGSESVIVAGMRKIVQKIWYRGNPGMEVSILAAKIQVLATTIKKHLGLEVV